MNKYLLYILFFLYALNFNAQKIKSVSVDNDTGIQEFLIENRISANDFFIINPNYSQSRFSYDDNDLSKKIFKGDIINVFYNENTTVSPKVNFISHKIKRKQNLSEISQIYNVSEKSIIQYNRDISVKRNNVLMIPVNLNLNSSPPNLLKEYFVKPKEGKWRIAYKYGISIELLEMLNPNIGSIIQVGQQIAVPNKNEISLNTIDDTKEFFEIQNNIEISVLEKNLGLKKNSIIDLNPSILNKDLLKGLIIMVPKYTELSKDVINLSKVSLEENITNSSKKKFAIILPFRLENFDYDSIQNSTPILKNDKLLNISLDFLFGAEMAVKSFSELGIDVKMDVFDSAINKDKIDKIIYENDFNNYDFIIGPLTNNLFNYLVNATEESGVKIVKPLSKKQNINKRIINTIPDDSILFNKIISHVKSDTVFSEKYIISDSRSLDVASKIKKIFPDSKQFFSKINESGIDTKTLVYDDLDSTFVKGKNIVFLETKEQGFVSNVTSILNSFVNDTIKIELVSTNKNNAFEGVNISNNYLSNLTFQYASTNKKIDLINDKFFIEKFINHYNYFPNKYALRAYDLVYDLLLRISNGDLDDPSIHGIETQYLENKFKYRTSSSGSIDNVGVFLMRHENLKISELIDK